ncbi:MAG: biotin/lipoyl-binding protein, partial [Anaerolineales bacterium]
MRQTRLRLLGGVLAGILLLGGCATGEAASPVATEPAEHQGNIVSAEGVVQPHKKADLAFQVAGRVEQVLVEEGQQVSTGDELLRLDTRDLEQNVLKAKAALASAQASLAKAQAGSRSEEITAAEAAVVSAQASKKTAELSVDISAGNLTS